MKSIHTTDRLNYKRCRQRWEFSSNLQRNLEPTDPQEALFFGTAMHEALAAYYDPATPRETSMALKVWNAYWEQNAELQLVWGERYDELVELGLAMLRHYCNYYAPANDNFTVLFVEREYNFDIGTYCKSHGFTPMDGCEFGCTSEDVQYSFRIDGIVRDTYKRWWLLEHKTARTINRNRKWLAMDEQVGSYIAVVQMVEGIQIEGVIYNTLAKNAPKPLRRLKNGTFSVDKSQLTTYDIARKELVEAGVEPMYREFLEALKERDDPFFHRELVRRNPKEIQLQWQAILGEVEEMLNPNLLITRNPGPFTCNFCSFYDPCVAKYEGSDFELILKSLYQERQGYERVDASGDA